MEEVEQYLENITWMWAFVEEFSVRATQVFKVKRIEVEEYARYGGPLICTFMMHSFEQMPSVEVVQALAEPLRRFSFDLSYQVVQDTGTEFNELMCYFQVAIDWGRDVYFIRRSDDF